MILENPKPKKKNKFLYLGAKIEKVKNREKRIFIAFILPIWATFGQIYYFDN